MCGIIGYVGKQKAKPILMEGLKRLEYRGYDSAGLAVLDKAKVKSVRAVGMVVELEKKIAKLDLKGQVGVAHTRWATHGKPSVANSHPHTDCKNKIAVVHNGIIENYLELKKRLSRRGHKFKSETDTEVIVHLIEEERRKVNDLFEAVQRVLPKLVGAYGIAVISEADPDMIVIAKKGSPLLFGVGDDEYIVSSDAAAIISYTKQVVYLNDGEVAKITPKGYQVVEIGQGEVEKESVKISWTQESAQKSGFKHYMLKEIHEQPQAIESAIRGRVDKFIKEGSQTPILGGLAPTKEIRDRLAKIKRIIIVSCGTSYYSGLVGEYMIEEYAGIPVEVETASEFRYRRPVIDENTAILAISQSGETADTLEAIREGKLKGALSLGVVNVVGSTIARETDAGVYNHAGPEIGVASTKAFTSQISILTLITLSLGRQRQMSFVMGKRIAEELKRIPGLVKKTLKKEAEIKKIAKKYGKYDNWLYLGRKYNFPIAMEGALKLKEISYAHAEGYAAGEMKHGPIAMIDSNFPSLFIIPSDSVYEKVVSGVEEIKARGGKVLAIATEGNKEIAKLADDVIYIPKTLEMLTPLLSVVPLQLLAYHIGVSRGYDVDKPRNLAKSVTVE
ncbi:MAG TPA: glutamine--fructose-6-phosphate transaminase (isomerizing) [Candidatus Moranbacteria bacterium]|nr:glutamine--fructose-6-phosphate transaminase (isomerizing) [Candidatus Moranbacteria bacterium]